MSMALNMPLWNEPGREPRHRWRYGKLHQTDWRGFHYIIYRNLVAIEFVAEASTRRMDYRERSCSIKRFDDGVVSRDA